MCYEASGGDLGKLAIATAFEHISAEKMPWHLCRFVKLPPYWLRRRSNAGFDTNCQFRRNIFIVMPLDIALNMGKCDLVIKKVWHTLNFTFVHIKAKTDMCEKFAFTDGILTAKLMPKIYRPPAATFAEKRFDYRDGMTPNLDFKWEVKMARKRKLCVSF